MEFELFPDDPLNPGFGWTARFGIPEAWDEVRHLTDDEARQLRNAIRIKLHELRQS